MNRALGWLATSRYAAVLLLLVGIVAYFAISEGSRFLSRANIENLLGSVSILWIVAIGMTFVVLTGGIDLSVGAVVALSGLVLAKLFNGIGVPALLAIVLTVGFGAALGASVNGLLIGRARPISTPFTPAPRSAPNATVSPTAGRAGTPRPLKSSARTRPERATTAPTDRSMPPVRTTNVMPIATIQRIDTLPSRFSTLARERNRLPSEIAK